MRKYDVLFDYNTQKSLGEGGMRMISVSPSDTLGTIISLDDIYLMGGFNACNPDE